jgi:hypothetical protein
VKIRQAGFALPLVLVMIVSCSVVGISAFKLFQDRGSRLQSTFARRQAVIAAESGFNWVKDGMPLMMAMIVSPSLMIIREVLWKYFYVMFSTIAEN